jgi:hypothetical protein
MISEVARLASERLIGLPALTARNIDANAAAQSVSAERIARSRRPAFCASSIWPPKIDVLEDRGPKSNNLVMTTHWRIPETQRVKHCGFAFAVADTSNAFHNYGVPWQPDRITYYIARKPVSELKVPIGFDDPIYMIVNLAIGSNHFPGVGFVDGESPVTVAFEIDRIYAYQIDKR